MNLSTIFVRKIVYLVVLLGMLVPLGLLGMPSKGGSDVGGQLTEMRVKYNIAESDLGEISPASETMKLASLGLRGVAATLLWNKAHEYRVKHEWDRLKATLNNIALLQPHYDKVWEHQAHNLAYNVSVEFDDYRQRYEMVREGTEFLTRGVRQNKNAPRLVWYTGWFYGQKLGLADEKEQFRRLFGDDEVGHDELMREGIAVDSPEALGPYGKPDNWLVGRLWLNRGYALVESGVQIRRQTPINFYETGPKWRIKHAEAIENEGVLDYRASDRWRLAHEEWKEFGKRSIPTLERYSIKLGEMDDLANQAQEKLEKFRELTSDAYKKAEAEKVAALSFDERLVYDKKPEERTEAGKKLMEYLKGALVPDLKEVVKQADPAVRLRAITLIEEMKDIGERANKTDGYRRQINYPYWETLSQAEQEARTLKARKLVYDAEQAAVDANLDKAIDFYEESFEIWAQVFDDYPVLVIDDTADDLYDSIIRYMKLIDSDELPEDFALYSFAEMMSNGSASREAYENFREQQETKAEARRKELEEEERQREEEAAKEAKRKAAAQADEKMKDDKDDDQQASEKKDTESDKAKSSDEATEKAKDEKSKVDSSDDADEPDNKPESPEAETPAEETADADASTAQPDGSENAEEDESDES
ncbi:MAG: IRE (iron responsive element) [Pirellulaceae bacterium]